MAKPLIQIDDEVREMTDVEYADYQAQQQADADRQSEIEAREQLRQSAIAKLVAGQALTQAEAELLVIR